MLTLVVPRVVARRLQRATAVSARNVSAMRHSAYWWVVVSGFFEPVLYLLAIGVGVGALIREIPLADGRLVPYATFVAPAMLAASAMNGALAETTFNFFGKMKYLRLYDAVLATPVAPFEIALGELLWALARGALYSGAFLAVMVGMGLSSVGGALAAFPATVLVGLTFGAIGMALATYVRGWQDFDYIIVIQFAMFLFSGTFAPPEEFPAAMRVVVALTPLYHAVELVRGLTVGIVGWGMLVNVGYLAGLGAAGLAIAGRRTAKILCK
jgi:lipooligosaccharide transport system permease protein